FVRGSKRLVRVISLNVDNVLELEVSRAKPATDEKRYLQVISRARHRPGRGIPTYHLHGFLPINVLQDIPRWARPRQRTRASSKKTSQDGEHMGEAVPE